MNNLILKLEKMKQNKDELKENNIYLKGKLDEYKCVNEEIFNNVKNKFEKL